MLAAVKARLEAQVPELAGRVRLAEDFAAKRTECDHAASQWVLDLAVLMNRTKHDYFVERRDALIALGKSRQADAAE